MGTADQVGRSSHLGQLGVQVAKRFLAGADHNVADRQHAVLIPDRDVQAFVIDAVVADR
jgi:hypothetical protein